MAAPSQITQGRIISGGATQNKAKRAAATRAHNAGARIDPPAKDPARPYNGGLAEAAKLSTEEWSSGLAPTKRVDVVDPVTGIVTREAVSIGDRYDWSCGIEPFEVFAARLFREAIKDDWQRARRRDRRWSSTVHQLNRDALSALVIHNRLQAKRNAGYYTRLIDVPAVLPQDLQDVSEVKAAGKTTVIRNGTELINPEWRPNRINGKHDLHYETNHGIPGAKYVPASINAVIIEHLIKTNGLVITGEMPDWCKALIDELAAKPAQSNEALVAGELERRYPVDAKDITRLMDAITDSVEHSKRADQPALPFGFVLNCGQFDWTAEHALIDRTWVVASRLNFKDDFKVVVKRGEVREMVMLKMKAVAENRAVQTNGLRPIGEAVKAVVKDVTQNVAHAASQPVTKCVTASNAVTPAKRDAIPAWNMVEVGGKVVVGL